MKITQLLLFTLLLVSCSSEPQSEPEDALNSIPVPPGAEVFVEICEDGQQKDGPWNNDLALNWMEEERVAPGEATVVVESGGVPTVIQNENGELIAAFQWFSCDIKEAFDTVAVSISEDDGETWSYPAPMVFDGLPEGYTRPFDPTLALLPDGRIRVYFTSHAEGITMFEDDTMIYSAISNDGINYTFEEGARFDVEGYAAYDVAVGYWDGLWHLTTPNNTPVNFAGAHYATSTDGLHFTQTEDLSFNAEMNWTGNMLAKEDGLYFYGTPSGREGNWSAKFNGETWEEPQFIGTYGGDPAVACIEEKCFVISVKMTTQ